MHFYETKVGTSCEMKINKVKQRTVPFHLAPNFTKHNSYIKKGYRKKLSIKNCLLSTLEWTNESINIWSHFIGFFIFVGLLIYDWNFLKLKINPTDYELFIAGFVLLSFMSCMLLSSIYHTFSCHSSHLLKTCLSLDIFGISLSFLAIFISGIYYGFWCDEHSHLRIVYSGLVLLLFAMAMFLLLVPSLKTDFLDSARLVLFIAWAVSGVLPTMHWAFLYKDSDSGMVKIFLTRIAVMYCISGVAIVVYIFRLPERFFPGRFDFLGASHQLWHLIMLGALYYWHDSGIMYAFYRHQFGCEF